MILAQVRYFIIYLTENQHEAKTTQGAVLEWSFNIATSRIIV
jgi:hypothetical protein